MKIVIIGNGIAGVTAARNIRKLSNHSISIISSESSYFFSRTALMYVYMGHMQFEHTQPYEDFFWEKNNIDLLFDHVDSVNFTAQKLELKSGRKIDYDQLIIASGSKPNFFGWKGQDLKGVQGLYSKQDLELMEENTKGIKKAVVVGGGLIGVEMTEMLLTRGIEVHFLIREANFWGSVLPKEESQLIMSHFKKHHGLVMHYGEELDEITADEYQQVKTIKTKNGTIIDTKFVGITVGVSANIDFVRNTTLELNRGILVNNHLETSIKNVYAIGDCAELRHAGKGRRTIEQVWYTGRIMGETVAKTICGQETAYQPGHWFNSAKFFDIEYQTYGNVSSKLGENEAEFVWQHQTEELLLHFVFDKSTKEFIGINNFGIRLRHEVFDAWLTQKRSIDFVLENLASANFDPEFYKTYEKEIINKYNIDFQTNLKLQKKTWWRNLLIQE